MRSFYLDVKLKGQNGWHCIDVIDTANYRAALDIVGLDNNFLIRKYEHENSVYVEDWRLSTDESERRSLKTFHQLIGVALIWAFPLIAAVIYTGL